MHLQLHCAGRNLYDDIYQSFQEEYIETNIQCMLTIQAYHERTQHPKSSQVHNHNTELDCLAHRG